MEKSLMLTGAPVTGKSTVTRSLRNNFGYIPSPDYTTRPIRPDEIDGIDKRFVSVEAFQNLHADGKLIETSLEYCNYQGNYYGSPSEWLDERELGDRRILTCVAVQIANLVHTANPNLIWVHLEADNSERATRLAQRGISDTEVIRRLRNNGGDSHINPENADLIINTSRTALDATLETIMEATQCQQLPLL